MATPEAELPETRERRCPTCQSEQIEPVGRVVAGAGLSRVQHRCETCGTAFGFVRKPII